MKMTFKRGFISGMFTLALVFGLYMVFFNHPPAGETLEANAHLHGAAERLGPPKFSDDAALSPGGRGGAGAEAVGGGGKDKRPRDRGAELPDGSGEAAAAARSPPPGRAGTGNGTSKPDTPPLGRDTDVAAADPGDQDNGRGAPLMAKQDRPAGGDGDTGDGAAATVEDGAAGPGSSAHRSIPKIDWEKWVRDNGLVDVGTIWGYCDEPETPTIGKILLMKDEDRGGLKVAVVMNTTFEESVESGSIFVSVMYSEMSFYEKSLDICTLYDDQEDDPDPNVEKDTFFNCPMAAGGKYYMKELHIPFFVPSGRFTAKAKLTDHKGRTVLCASADMKL